MLSFVSLLVFAVQAWPGETTGLPIAVDPSREPIVVGRNHLLKRSTTLPPITGFRVPAEYEPVSTVIMAWKGGHHVSKLK